MPLPLRAGALQGTLRAMLNGSRWLALLAGGAAGRMVPRLPLFDTKVGALVEDTPGEPSRVMRYKGYDVTVTVDAFGSANPIDPRFTVRCDDALVYEGAVQGQFPDYTAAEDAAYGAAREWIEAKCRVN